MRPTIPHLRHRTARLIVIALVAGMIAIAGQGSASAESWLGGGFARGFWTRLTGASSPAESIDLRQPQPVAMVGGDGVIMADRRIAAVPGIADEVPLAVALDRAGPSWDYWGKDAPAWWRDSIPVSRGITADPVLALPGIDEPPPSATLTADPWRDLTPTMHPSYPDHYAPFAPLQSRGFKKVVHNVISDYRNFYSCESVVGLTAVFGAGALMANTGFDQTVQSAWQTSVTPTGFGHFVAGTKFLGEGRYELPVWGAAAITGILLENSVIGDVAGEWGSRSLRMFTVGAPPLYVLQLATGASRPADGQGSHWHMLNDNNGVSGHAFIGAIPFLAAADMVENPWAKGGLYVCSTFCGLSRMDANAHYPSQVFLGWSLAFASSMAVNGTELEYRGMTVKAVPLPIANGTGVAMEARW